MTRRALLLALLLPFAGVAPAPGAPAAGSAGAPGPTGAGAPADPVAPVPARALLARLRSAGRAEAAVRLRRVDPSSGRTSERSGRLALELPRLARLDLDDGERLTLRADGGDWVQPALRQLVRAGPRGAAGALQWWGALLDPAGAGLEERRTGERSFTLRLRGGVPASAGPGTTQRIELDAAGLPRRLTIGTEDGGRLEYRLARWRFVRPRGATDFVLAAPAGFDVVRLP